MKRNTNAFTLAEVLITLGIIGVVAALTLPTLMQNYKRVVYTTKMKRFCSAWQQTIVRSQVDNGPAQYWEKWDAATPGGQYDFDINASIVDQYLAKLILPYMQNVSTYKLNNLMTYRMNDGSEFQAYNGNCIDIYYDINGIETPPNEFGKDKFDFLFCLNEIRRNQFFHDPNKMFGGYNGTYKTRAQAISDCINNSKTCSSLLEMDGCEFKKDYPHKLP